MWEPFGSYLLNNRAANPAQFEWKWSGLVVLYQQVNPKRLQQPFFIFSGYFFLFISLRTRKHNCPHIFDSYYFCYRWCELSPNKNSKSEIFKIHSNKISFETFCIWLILVNFQNQFNHWPFSFNFKVQTIFSENVPSFLE